MSRLIRLVVGLSLTTGLLFAGPIGVTAAPPDPFVGAWQGIDAGDDSLLSLTISGGSHRAVLRDTSVSVGCPPGTPAVATGAGMVSPATVITLDFEVLCLADRSRFDFPGYTLTHQAVSDTLTHADGTVFTRVGS